MATLATGDSGAGSNRRFVAVPVGLASGTSTPIASGSEGQPQEKASASSARGRAQSAHPPGGRQEPCLSMRVWSQAGGDRREVVSRREIDNRWRAIRAQSEDGRRREQLFGRARLWASNRLSVGSARSMGVADACETGSAQGRSGPLLGSSAQPGMTGGSGFASTRSRSLPKISPGSLDSHIGPVASPLGATGPVPASPVVPGRTLIGSTSIGVGLQRRARSVGYVPAGAPGAGARGEPPRLHGGMEFSPPGNTVTSSAMPRQGLATLRRGVVAQQAEESSFTSINSLSANSLNAIRPRRAASANRSSADQREQQNGSKRQPSADPVARVFRRRPREVVLSSSYCASQDDSAAASDSSNQTSNPATRASVRQATPSAGVGGASAFGTSRSRVRSPMRPSPGSAPSQPSHTERGATRLATGAPSDHPALSPGLTGTIGSQVHGATVVRKAPMAIHEQRDDSTASAEEKGGSSARRTASMPPLGASVKEAGQAGRSKLGDEILVLLSGAQNARGHGGHGPRTPRRELAVNKEQALPKESSLVSREHAGAAVTPMKVMSQSTTANREHSNAFASPVKALRVESGAAPASAAAAKQRLAPQALQQRPLGPAREGNASPSRRSAPAGRSAEVRSRSLPKDPAMISEQLLHELRSSLAAAAAPGRDLRGEAGARAAAPKDTPVFGLDAERYHARISSPKRGEPVRQEAQAARLSPEAAGPPPPHAAPVREGPAMVAKAARLSPEASGPPPPHAAPVREGPAMAAKAHEAAVPPPPAPANKHSAEVKANREAKKDKIAAVHHCVWCIRPGAIMVCSGCDVARYCNNRCQKAHWPEHRKECSKVKKVPLPPEPAPAG